MDAAQYRMLGMKPPGKAVKVEIVHREENMAEKTNVPLWTFYYHQGPAPKYGTVEAKDEGTALKVATRWCMRNGARPPASVQPMILATEAILREKEPGPEPEALPDPVAATTGINKG